MDVGRLPPESGIAIVVLCRNVKSRITVVHNLLEMSTVAVKSSSVVLSS